LLGGKGGPKLKAAGADEGESYVSATVPQAGMFEITGRGASMSQLAATLERVTSAPAWDKTGLSGKFDFQLRARTESATSHYPAVREGHLHTGLDASSIPQGRF
jgi:uncharacterized protein (TIGR03435 family)